MRDIDTVTKAMEEAQAVLAEYTEPGERDPQATLQRMLEILDREEVVAAQNRLNKGYGQLRLIEHIETA